PRPSPLSPRRPDHIHASLAKLRLASREKRVYYFFGAVGTAFGLTGAAGGKFVSAVFTAGEILSAFASNTLTCHSCVSFKRPLNPGIPVKRMPFSAFQ